MGSFADLVVNIKADVSNFNDGMRKVVSRARTTQGILNESLSAPAKKAGMEFKDVGRIVQGILISKAFYSGMNAIRNCTNAVWDFNKSLEYSKIAYSNLFGDTALAEEFINVLKDFAAVTPYSFKESEQAAKKLLTYGIQYKNVMYMMQGIMSASAMSGNPQTIDSVSRAMGQIYTKGRLMNEEMRQLAEAGIPAYEILRDELGLTQEQLQRIGDEAIPASVAINALIDGMNKRYGDVAAASSKTMQGIISNIVDNATMIASSLVDPMVQSSKTVLNALGQILFKIREIMEVEGLGGVFEHFIPPELQGVIKQTVSNIMFLVQVIKQNLVNVILAARIAFGAFIAVFNTFGPAILSVLNVLSYMVHAVLSNEKAVRFLSAALAAAAAMWIVFKIQAISALVATKVSKAIADSIVLISRALTFLIAHPAWAFLFVAVGLVAALTGSFTKLGNTISGYFNKLTSFNGFDSDKLFIPDQKERNADLNKFNEALGDTNDAMKELDKNSKKAATNGLQSFDEVFSLKPDEGTGDGIQTDNMPDLSALENLDLGGFMPEIPDFTGFADLFVTDLIAALADKLKNAAIGATLGALIGGLLFGPLGAKIGALAGGLAGLFWDELSAELQSKFKAAGIGALLGALLGTLLFGPLGAKIGAVAGALAGYFWDDFAKFFGLTDVGKIAIPIATVLGAAIGGLLGGPAGALIGAGIGALVGWLIDSIARGVETGDWSNMGYPIGAGIGAAIGFVAGGPAGALIGGSIGLLAGWLYDMINTGLTTGEWDFKALSVGIGSSLGIAIGLVAGGPAGALIGLAVGTLVGWIVSKFIEADWSGVKEAFIAPWKTLKDWVAPFFEGLWTDIKTSWNNKDWVSLGLNVVKGIALGLVGAGAAILAAIGTVFISIWEGFCKIFGIHSPAEEMKPIGLNIVLGIAEGIASGITDVVSTIVSFGTEVIGAFADWFVGIGDAISDWSVDAIGKLNEWQESAAEVITTWASDTYDNFNEWSSDVSTKFSEWSSTVKNGLSEWSSETIASFNSWSLDTTLKITTWITDTTDKLRVWSVDTLANINKWASDTGMSITNWYNATLLSITTWATDTTTKITTWSTDMITSISEWATTTSASFAEWSTNLRESFTTFITESKTSFTDFISSTKMEFGEWFRTISEGARNTFGDFAKAVSGAMTDALANISNFCSNATAKLSTWASDFGSKVTNTLNGASTKVSTSVSGLGAGTPKTTTSKYGHADGGIFNREHVANFAEGNKAEAIIPLENASAMQPFVDAVSNGLIQSIAPMVASISGNNSTSQDGLRPLYVGTLIADESSLTELYRKMNVIELNENKRRGV